MSDRATGGETRLKKVISASRRVEMPGFFPDLLADLLESRCPPGRVHTVVLWTKRPGPLLDHPRLRACLARYGQLFCHLTVTGMGGTPLEPGIPPASDVLGRLPELVDFVKSPDRIDLRFDPLVRLRLADGTLFTNAGFFGEAARAAARAGIRSVVTSRMTAYAKVRRRLASRGMQAEEARDEWRREEDGLRALAAGLGLNLSGCCTDGWPVYACVDGRRLTALHPRRERASDLKARGQRPGCGCTESWDIGWYQACPGGCVYCYANAEDPGSACGLPD
jgi:hypothetical protein